MRITMFLAAVLGASSLPASAQQQPEAARPLAVGASVTGVLTPSDSRRASGKFADDYLLSGRRGERVELRLSSEDFDPYLLVTGPDAFSIANDDDADGDGTLDSRLVISLPADGAYRVLVTSFRPGATGEYRLSAAAPAAGAALSQPERAQAIALGGSVTGTLARGDQAEGGHLVDRYRFSARRGQRVALELSSDDFDTMLSLRTPDGDVIDNDDSGPRARPSTNSRIEAALAEDGDYLVTVTSFAAGATGKYRLSLRPSQGSARQAAVRSGPRVFALMVGVSDYGGRTTDLPNTDQDALRLHAALQKEGLLNPASVVLTNADATRPAVEAAFARIAEQAGPDDLFLFFFSGHGDQIDAAPGARELDGLSETIELRDTAMTDAELAGLFAKVRSRTALILIDSCFSGGFRELVNRAGMMALLSSEEDLTSDVALDLGSGGYLSHFLPGALTGDADIDGDAMITAGELATHLRRQFARQGEIGATTVDRQQRNLQQLVVERGGVQVDDVIIRLNPSAVRTAAR
ncbi:MAG: caspase family protein [Pseudomonadota bacterium]|nr:caspase family protein [Pseudomonadota bacterium]